MAFKITTTGTQDLIVFNDLGARSFSHPTIDYDLEQEFDIDEISKSNDIQNAINQGWITAEDGLGNPVTNILGYYLTADQKDAITHTPNTINASNPLADKMYVDAVSVGIHPLTPPARVATTTALPSNTYSNNTITATTNGSINDTGIDSITNLTLNDRILVKDETDKYKNGVYYVSQVGDASNPWILTRTTDADTWEEIRKALILIDEGTVNKNSGYLCVISDSGTLGVDDIDWELYSRFESAIGDNIGTGGVGIYKDKVGNVLQFKSINVGSSKMTVTDDVSNNEVDLDIDESNIVHDNLSGAGTKTHSEIDTHIDSTSNPHSVTKDQVGLGNVQNVDTTIAANVTIQDSDDKYNASNVETALAEIGETKFWNGFDRQNPDSMGDLSWNNSTRTMTISPKSGESDFHFWSKGKKFSKTSSQSIQIPDTTGAYYLYFDENGSIQYILQTSLVLSYYENYALFAFVYWNATDSIGLPGDERHGIRMSGATHAYNHLTTGARYEDGMDIEGLVSGNKTYTKTTSGHMWDEDIRHIISEQTTHKFLYRKGTNGEWTVTSANNYVGYLPSGNTYYVWNEWDGSTWKLSEGTYSTDYYIYFFVAIPNIEGYSIYKLISQSAYSSAGNARTAIENEMRNIVLTGLPSPEMIFLYSVIVKRNGNLVAMSDGSVYYDLRYLRGGVGNSDTTHIDTEIKKAKDIYILMTNYQYNQPYLDTVSLTYVSAARFIFRGTDIGTPTKIKATCWVDNVGDIGAIKIYDLTNSATIAENNNITNTTESIIDLGTLSNLPSSEAIWEVQFARPTGSGQDKFNLSSLLVEFN